MFNYIYIYIFFFFTVQDSQGCTALHIAITSRHPSCAHILLQQPRLDLSVKDNRGSTPFAAALATKDNETGLAILKREPKAAEQVSLFSFSSSISSLSSVCFSPSLPFPSFLLPSLSSLSLSLAFVVLCYFYFTCACVSIVSVCLCSYCCVCKH